MWANVYENIVTLKKYCLISFSGKIVNLNIGYKSFVKTLHLKIVIWLIDYEIKIIIKIKLMYKKLINMK